MRKKRAEGIDIIDFGIGDPDLPTPPAIVEEVKRQLDDPANHRYPSSSGEPEVRRAVADWYKKRFNVSLDPDGEVAILIGGKEGIANICRAFVNPGEKVLCPDPGYPVYSQGGTLLSDAVPVKVPHKAGEELPAGPGLPAQRCQDALPELPQQPHRGRGHQGIPVAGHHLVHGDGHHILLRQRLLGDDVRRLCRARLRWAAARAAD